MLEMKSLVVMYRLEVFKIDVTIRHYLITELDFIMNLKLFETNVDI